MVFFLYLFSKLNQMKKILLVILLNISFLFAQKSDAGIYNVNTDSSYVSYKTNACASTNNLTTFYAQNNGQNGIMFDISATQCVAIRCFESNMDNVSTTVEIYYKAGTHVGFQNTPGAWTFLGSTVMTGCGINVPCTIPININVLIPAGQTYAFYITGQSSYIMNYTNGTGVGNILASDANIIIREGTGKDYAFTSNYQPRQFNGTVFYDVVPGCVLPLNDLNIESDVVGKTAIIKWSSVENDVKEYEIQKLDSNSFISLYTQIAFGNGSVNYIYKDENISFGKHIYRIKQIMNNGSFNYSDNLEVNIVDKNYYSIVNEEIIFDKEYEFKIYDINSKLIFDGFSKNYNYSNFKPGVYIIKINFEETIKIIKL